MFCLLYLWGLPCSTFSLSVVPICPMILDRHEYPSQFWIVSFVCYKTLHLSVGISCDEGPFFDSLALPFVLAGVANMPHKTDNRWIRKREGGNGFRGKWRSVVSTGIELGEKGASISDFHDVFCFLKRLPSCRNFYTKIHATYIILSVFPRHPPPQAWTSYLEDPRSQI